MKLEWGDTVVISGDADESQRPGSKAIVCGSRKLDKKQALRLQLPPGMLYEVEFDDGHIIEIHEQLLKAPKKPRKR